MNIKEIIKEVVSFLFYVAVMFIVIRLVFAFVAEPFKVDGRSMEYSLHDGERMFMLKQADLERFDVVVFPDPRTSAQKEFLEQTNPEEAEEIQVPLYVKRIIGVPGDNLSYENDQLILNGEPLDEPYLEELASEFNGDFTSDFTLYGVTGENVIPEGQVLVLGDNRRNSLDGRAFGLIDIEDIIGEANLIYWPLNQIRLLDQYELSEDGQAIVVE